MLYLNEKGQTLIEVIVAIVLCSLILVGLTKLIASSFTNVDFSENQVNASTLAQDGMAAIGSLHDTDYATFANDVPAISGSSKTYCLAQGQDATNLPAGPGPCTTPNAVINNNSYIRSIILENDTLAGKCKGDTQVTVNVQWKDKDCSSSTYCHSSQLVSCYGPAL